MNNLPNCDQNIFDNGDIVAVFAVPTGNADHVEAWVRDVAAVTGQKVDWHFFAGRVVVKALGDTLRVAKAIECLKHSLPKGTIW